MIHSFRIYIAQNIRKYNYIDTLSKNNNKQLIQYLVIRGREKYCIPCNYLDRFTADIMADAYHSKPHGHCARDKPEDSIANLF